MSFSILSYLYICRIEAETTTSVLSILLHLAESLQKSSTSNSTKDLWAHWKHRRLAVAELAVCTAQVAMRLALVAMRWALLAMRLALLAIRLALLAVRAVLVAMILALLAVRLGLLDVRTALLFFIPVLLVTLATPDNWFRTGPRPATRR
jgi:hypothetical protein